MIPRTGLSWMLQGLGALALASLPLWASPYYIELGTYALIAAMVALSLQLLVGCTGLVSLGHAAFYGFAAYVVYLITPADAGRSMLLTLPAAALAAGLLAFVVGALSLRTKGFFFLMVTLAFGQMVFFVFHDTKIGGGTDGAYLARPLLAAFGFELELNRRQKPVAVFYLSLALLIAMYLALVWIVSSLFGRVLEGIRVNEHRMQSLGFNTYRYKLAAFVIAGVLAGIAGHQWAMHRGFVNPELVSWHRSAEALLMILLGGLGSLSGPVLGAILFTCLAELPELPSLLAPYQPFGALIEWIGKERVAALQETMRHRKLLVEGIIILLVVLMLPKGMVGLFRRRRRGDPREGGADD